MFAELLLTLRDYSLVQYLKFKFRTICSEYMFIRVTLSQLHEADYREIRRTTAEVAL
jgi:hypothetical protein